MAAAAQPPGQRRRDVVGPNAAIQLAGALSDLCGPAVGQAVFAGGGRGEWFAAPPDRMIPEADAARLFAATRAALPPAVADRVLAEAGRRTGAYILANRIPAAARRVLPLLPRRIAAAVLRRAILRAAWTFAGSGRCTVAGGQGLGRIEITANPLATPGAPWHRAVFDVLFGALVRGGAVSSVDCPAVTQCSACRNGACRFALLTPAEAKGAGRIAAPPLQ